MFIQIVCQFGLDTNIGMVLLETFAFGCFQINVDDAVQVDAIVVLDPLAGDHQKILNDIRRPLAGALNRFDLGPHRAVGRQIQQQQFRIAHQSAEDIVQVMGHASCQSADGLHFFGLLQLSLEVFALVDILGDPLGT